MLKMAILVIFGPQDSLVFWPLEAASVKSPEFERTCTSARQFLPTFTFFRSLLANVYLNNLAKCKKQT